MMKITKIVVTDEDGKTHTFEGAGWAAIRAISKKGQPYQQDVTVGLTLPPKPEVKPDGM